MTASPKWQPNQTPDRQPSSVDSGANRRPPAKPSPKRTESPPALFQLPDLSSEGGVAGPDQAVSASSDSDSTIDRNALPESNHPVTSVAANPSLTPETDTRSASNSEPSSNRVWQPIEEFAEPDRIQPHRVDAALRDTESRNTEPRKGESTDSVPVPVLDTKGTRVISIVLLAMIVSFAAIAVRGLKRFGTPSSDETTEGANLIAESDTTKQRSELEIAPPEISTLTPEVTDALASGTPTPLDAKSFESAFPSSREDIASLDSLPDVSGDSDVDISFDHPFFQGEESTLGGPTSDAMAMSSEAQAISQDGTLGLSSPQNIASGNSVRGNSVRGNSVRGNSVPEFNSAQGNTAAQESFGETPSQLAATNQLPIGQPDPGERATNVDRILG